MKKYLALILTLVLALAAVIPAYAATTSADTDAGIKFDKDDPGFIDDPFGGQPEGALDFGIHDLLEVAGKVQNYNSQRWANRSVESAPTGGAGEKTSISMQNGEQDGWHVTVEIGAFIDEATSAQTMQGYTLKLNNIKDDNKYSSTVNPPVVTSTITLQEGDQDLVVTAAATHGIGKYSLVYDGDLNIPNNSNVVLLEGRSQAVLDWTFINAPA